MSFTQSTQSGQPQLIGQDLQIVDFKRPDPFSAERQAAKWIEINNLCAENQIIEAVPFPFEAVPFPLSRFRFFVPDY